MDVEAWLLYFGLYDPVVTESAAVKQAEKWNADVPYPGDDKIELFKILHDEAKVALKQTEELVLRQDERSTRMFTIASTLLAALFAGVSSGQLALFWSAPSIACLVAAMFWGIKTMTPIRFPAPIDISKMIELTTDEPTHHWLHARYLHVRTVGLDEILKWKVRLVGFQQAGIMTGLVLLLLPLIARASPTCAKTLGSWVVAVSL